MEREDGYYWIKTEGDWAVAQWSWDVWYLPGLDYHIRPETIEEIDERRVVRDTGAGYYTPMPKEYPSRPCSLLDAEASAVLHQTACKRVSYDIEFERVSLNPTHKYMCVVCGQVPVDAEDGFDTCPDCANKI